MLRAFGARGTPVPLAGGQGRSWRVGDVVLKPVGDPAEAAWAAGLLNRVAQHGFRVPRPVPAADGAWTVAGWAAHRWVAGDAGPAGRWPELFAAARAFHRAVAHEPRPAFLDARDHRWARADRAAWGETDPDVLPALAGVRDRLRGLIRPADGPAQLVHGDLSGNVLVAPGLAPAVIDLSPYWRPAAWAEAVAVADGLLWWGEGPGLLTVAGRAGDPALVARGALFRLHDLDEHLRDRHARGAARGRAAGRAVVDPSVVEPYLRVASLLERLPAVPRA